MTKCGLAAQGMDSKLKDWYVQLVRHPDGYSLEAERLIDGKMIAGFDSKVRLSCDKRPSAVIDSLIEALTDLKKNFRS